MNEPTPLADNQKRNEGVPSRVHSPSLFEIFWVFLKISFSTFATSTGYMKREVVDRLKWIEEHDFLDGYALSEFIPQPDSFFGIATHIGHLIRGIPGAFVAAVAVCIPTFFLVTVMGLIYLRFADLPEVVKFIDGASAAICGLLIATFLEITKGAIHLKSSDQENAQKHRMIFIPLCIGLVFFLLEVLHLHITVVILLVAPWTIFLNAPKCASLVTRRVLLAACCISLVAIMVEAAPLVRISFIRDANGETLHHTQSEESPAQVTCPADAINHLAGNRSEGGEADHARPKGFSDTLVNLVKTLSVLSVCAMGGEETILPCMQQASVIKHGWMSPDAFVGLFAASFVLPGPTMFAGFIGLKATQQFGFPASLLGQLVAVLAIFLPSFCLIYVIARLWQRIKVWAWSHAVSSSMMVIASGALSAAILIISKPIILGPLSLILAIGTLVIVFFTESNPVISIIVAGAVSLLF